MKIRINITRELIVASAYCNYERECPATIPYKQLMEDISKPIAEKCLLALAVRELVPFAVVGCNYILYPLASPFPRYSNRAALDIEPDAVESKRSNDEIVQFIKRFDDMSPAQRMEHIKPTSFEINIPDRVIELIGIQEVDRILKDAKYLEKV